MQMAKAIQDKSNSSMTVLDAAPPFGIALPPPPTPGVVPLPPLPPPAPGIGYY